MINYIKENHLSLLVILFLVVSSVLGKSPSDVINLGATTARTTITNPWVFTQGAYFNASTTQVSQFLSEATTTSRGTIIADGGLRMSNPNSTSTSAVGTTQIVFENDIAPGGRCYSALIFRQVSTASAPATTTYAVAATSTFPNFIPTAGDSCRMKFEAGTSSASQIGAIWNFAAAGWDVEVASSTAIVPNNLTTAGGTVTELEFYRRYDTDITVRYLIGKDGD